MGRSCLLRVALSVAAPVVVIGVMVGVAVCLGGGFTLLGDRVGPDQRTMLGLAMMPLGLGLVLVLVLAPLMGWRHRLNRRLSEAFGSLGLEGRPLRFSSLQFHGHIDGRVAEAYWMRGPMLDFLVEADLGTRASAVGDNPLARGVHGGGVSVPGLDGILVIGDDAPWCREVFSDRAARAALKRILDVSRTAMCVLYLRPDSVMVRLRGAGVLSVADALASIAGDVIVIAGTAECVAPNERLVATPTEARRGPRWAIPGGIWTVFGITLVPMLGVLALFAVVLVVLALSA